MPEETRAPEAPAVLINTDLMNQLRAMIRAEMSAEPKEVIKLPKSPVYEQHPFVIAARHIAQSNQSAVTSEALLARILRIEEAAHIDAEPFIKEHIDKAKEILSKAAAEKAALEAQQAK